MKKLILVMVLLTASCRMENISTACPPIVKYTERETREILRIKQEVNNIVLDKFIMDYGELREMIRICKKEQ